MIARRLASVLLIPTILVSLAACHNEYAGVVSIERAPEYQDAALLERAWRLPAAAHYRAAGGLRFQKNISFCGPATMVNVIHSRGEGGPTQDDVLARAGLHFWSTLGGLTLDEEADLARRLGARATVLRDLDLESFRARLREANSEAVRFTVNFHRGPLFGRGGGHHSPIGGYLEEVDLVLVLDVNQHFGPWLVKSERLLAAMNTIDGSTGKKRGLLRIE